MALSGKLNKLVGLIIGAVLLVAGIGSAFLYQYEPKQLEPEEIVRPVKSMVIGAAYLTKPRNYPGKVNAGDSVTRAFEVSGRVVELPIVKGEKVKKGQLLVKLDDRDYRNAHDASKAEFEKADINFKRISKAAESGAVPQIEVTNALAALNQARAQFNSAKKHLEDCEILADFDGFVSNTFVDNFQNISAKQPILSLQDVTTVEIVVNVPEQRVAFSDTSPDVDSRNPDLKSRFVAVFDYLPDEEFDVKVKEFATEADPATQTFQATFSMPASDKIKILPGMTATIKEIQLAPESKTSYILPISATPIDEATGKYFVWILKPATGSKLFTVHKTFVEVGEMTDSQDENDNQIEVLVKNKQGKTVISNGDRVATAGVYFLKKEQIVSLFESRGQED